MSKCPVRSVQCPQLSRAGAGLSSPPGTGAVLLSLQTVVIGQSSDVSGLLSQFSHFYDSPQSAMQPARACVRGGRCSGGSGYSVAAAEFWVAAQCKFSWNCLHTASCLRIISCFLNEQNTSRNPGTLARDGGAEHKLLIASDISLLIFSFFIVSLVSYTKCLFLIDLINIR